MLNQLINITLTQFEEANTSDISKSTENLFKLVLESIIHETVPQAENRADEFTCYYDAIYESLGIEDNQDKESIYYFGQIKALTDLLYNLGEYHKNILTEIDKDKLARYKLLIPIVKLIGERGRISGTAIQRELRISSRSNLSNFFSRIKDFELIDSRKVGNKKIYFLSAKGEALWDNLNEQNEKNIVSIEQFLGIFLLCLEKELKKDRPSAIRVITKANLECKCKKQIGNTMIVKEHLAGIIKGARQQRSRELSAEIYEMTAFETSIGKPQMPYEYGNVVRNSKEIYGKYSFVNNYLEMEV